MESKNHNFFSCNKKHNEKDESSEKILQSVIDKLIVNIKNKKITDDATKKELINQIKKIRDETNKEEKDLTITIPEREDNKIPIDTKSLIDKYNESVKGTNQTNNNKPRDSSNT